MRQKAVDVLREGICYYCCLTDHTKQLGPGQVVMKMSAEKREILKTLKSEDLQNVRPDTIFGTPERQKEWGFEPKKRKGRWGL